MVSHPKTRLTNIANILKQVEFEPWIYCLSDEQTQMDPRRAAGTEMMCKSTSMCGIRLINMSIREANWFIVRNSYTN